MPLYNSLRKRKLTFDFIPGGAERKTTTNGNFETVTERGVYVGVQGFAGVHATVRYNKEFAFGLGLDVIELGLDYAPYLFRRDDGGISMTFNLLTLNLSATFPFHGKQCFATFKPHKIASDHDEASETKDEVWQFLVGIKL